MQPLRPSARFGQRFGGRKSEVQAERRLERSRNATTAAVPLTEATAHAVNKMPLTTDARGVSDRADEGARSNEARVGRGGHHRFS